ncbi:MAG: hypothetical protein IJ880_00490 [Bacilli bacterium]|nr:hypothetical protein [Bacilli bacterium]
MKISQKQVNNLETDIAAKEDSSNKVTTIDQDSTDTEYPSAKAVYDKLSTTVSADSPALTGTPTAPTAATSVKNTQIATTKYVYDVLGENIQKDNNTIGIQNVTGSSEYQNPAIKITINGTTYLVPAVTGSEHLRTTTVCHSNCHSSCRGGSH